MSVVMLAARRVGWIGRLPPHEITTASLRRAEVASRTGPGERRRLGWLAHLAMGSGAGAVFAVLLSRLRLPGTAPAQGAAFGAALWLASYQGWVPALGLLPPATSDRPARQLSMVVAHLVYGSTLGVLVPRVLRKTSAAR